MTTPEASALPPASTLAGILDGLFTPICRAFAASLDGDAGVWLERRRHDPRRVEQPAGGKVAKISLSDISRLRQLDLTFNVHSPAGTAENAIPCGVYGPAFAMALATTAQALADNWDRWWAGAYPTYVGARDRARVPVDVLTAATFWGASDLRGKDVAALAGHAVAIPMGNTLHDGIGSVAQALGHLTIDRVAPYAEDPLGLLDSVVQADLATQIALRTGLNVLGPMSVRGLTFPMPPVVFEGGVSELSAPLIEWLHREKRLGARTLRDRTDDEKRAEGTAAAGVGCPVALGHVRNTRTVIRDLAELVLAGVRQTYQGG